MFVPWNVARAVSWPVGLTAKQAALIARSRGLPQRAPIRSLGSLTQQVCLPLLHVYTFAIRLDISTAIGGGHLDMTLVTDDHMAMDEDYT
jgi:hypothetical protein